MLAGASRDFAPLNGSKTWRGITSPVVPQKEMAQYGAGFLKPILTVWLSILSIRAMSL